MERLVFVFTGILEEFTRAEAEAMVKEKGHMISDTVNQKTSFLIAGVRAGEKLTRAGRTGTPVITEKQFSEMIKDLKPFSSEPVLLKAKPGILYMIGEISYEYNDEVYNKSEGITPTKLFRDPNKARAEMIKLEKKEWNDWDHPLTTMNYSLEDSIKNERLLTSVLRRNGVLASADEILNVSYDDSLEHEIYAAIQKMNATDFGLFYDSVNIRFHEICEVEFPDS